MRHLESTLQTLAAVLGGFVLTINVPALAQPSTEISQGATIIQSFTGAVSIGNADHSEPIVLEAGQAGIPLRPGDVLIVGPNSSVLLRCAIGKTQRVTGPIRKDIKDICPRGTAMANRAIAVEAEAPSSGIGSVPPPFPQPEPIRGLW